MLNRLFNEAAPDGVAGGGATPVAQPVTAPVTTATPVATTAPPPQKWPDTWRMDMSGGDEKEVKQLERYASPADIWRKARALEQRLSSGELKSAFPKDATEEQVKQWRTENGVPESPDKYELQFDDGVIDDNDKELVGDILKTAHESNLTKEQAKNTIQAIADLREKRTEARQEKDAQIAKETQDALRAEFGPDYRQNVNLIKGLLDTGPTGLKQKLLSGRMADGTPIGSDPDVLRFLATVARQINPVTTLIPGAGANIAGAIDDELSKLNGMMGNRGSEYWKGPNAEKNQKRYRELVSARDRMGNKKAS